ncbi:MULTISPECIES: O-antigen ligase [unclassified Bacillus (in: firmicutes)]|uniref:O-antigen ligase family protein n=1 Tax=unclassified Bacillus (in: firmicutes) TaxID=185979 RepID=UPI0008E24E87|nr:MULTISPECIES: O-antigen ligase family protein [unclassified Bacillus (in: firmicutes)]SFB25466.1 O-antigen ligase [Bacillus sp. UNCCL13]SFQ91753.1 O-antigen ligase [Bacillus sp. cl95]
MNVLRNDRLILTIAVLLVTLSIVSGNTYAGLAVSGILAIFALMKRETGLLLLILFTSLRPFLIEMNPGLKITGDLIIFSLLIATIFLNRKNIKSLFHFHMFEIALFVFLGLGIVSALLTGVDLKAIIVQIRAYVLFYFVYYVFKRMDVSKEFVLKVVQLTFVTAVIMSLHGYIEKISDKTFLMPEAWKNWTLSATNHIRVYGLLKGPNELSLYLAIAFLISLYLLVHYTGVKKWIVYSGLAVIGSTFLLTYSRGAFLALFVFIAVYMILFRSIKKTLPLLLVFICSAGLFFAVNFVADTYQEKVLYAEEPTDDIDDVEKTPSKETGYNRYKNAFSEDTLEKSGSDGRIYYVTKAIEVFKDHPIIGTGFGTFGGAATLAYSSPIYDDYDIGFNFYSDNQYILTLAETGILGVLILTLLVFGFLKITIKMFREKSDTSLSITLVFFFVTMMVGGLVYNILENDTFMLYYFLAMALAARKLGLEKKEF